jgi:peptidoglycan/LPS O-acetylase OafA/YrhL
LTQTLRKTKGSKLPALTSLRLFAALVVVLHHARGFLIASSYEFPAREAVSFFFVLSGFIMAYTYDNRVYSLKSYYTARIARILPGAWLSLAAYVIILNPFVFIHNAHTPAIPIFSFFLVQSWVPIPAYYWGLNSVLWSISVEVFFYLVFPFLQRSVKAHGILTPLVIFPILAGGIVIAISTKLQLPDYSASNFNSADWQGMLYINPLSRLKEFTIGILAGMLFLRLPFQLWKGRRAMIWFSLAEISDITLKIWGWFNIDCSSPPSPLPSPPRSRRTRRPRA